jgi:hypothetical protein
MAVMLHLFSLGSLLINNYFRGTRVHLYPLLMGFALYSLAFFFGVYEEVTYYYYYLMCLLSLLLSFFFGTTNYYSSFELSGSHKHRVGCVQTSLKGGSQNRVMIYYPTPKDYRGAYQDYKWAHDGEHTIKGLMKFGADILPKGPFRHLESVR